MRVQHGQMLIRWRQVGCADGSRSGCADGGRLVAQLESFRLKPKGIRADLMVLTDCFDDAKICNLF